MNYSDIKFEINLAHRTRKRSQASNGKLWRNWFMSKFIRTALGSQRCHGYHWCCPEDGSILGLQATKCQCGSGQSQP